MTILPPPTRAIALRLVDEGFWVADDGGAFAGTVDRHGGHFYVRNAFGEYVGDYADLPTATAALTAAAHDMDRADASLVEPPC